MYAISSQELETLIRFNAPVAIVDVRKPKARSEDASRIVGAVDRAFDDVPAWKDEFAATSAVVCYCVHGHEVSQRAVADLRHHGIAAYYLKGGLDRWKAESGPLQVG